MIRKSIILGTLLCFVPILVSAQGFRIGDNAPITSSLTAPGVISTLAASIAICNSPANAVPCTNKASTFTSATLATPCSTSTQVVLAGTSVCVTNTDSRGNWGAWVAAGNYDFTVTVTGGNSFGPFTLSAGLPTGAAISPGAVTACQLNNLFIPGSSCYANIAAAQAAAGATGGVLIPPNYAGTDTYTNPNGNNTVLDLRGGTSLGAIPSGIQIGTCPSTGMPGAKPVDNGNTCFGYGVLSVDNIGYDDTGFGLGALQATTVAAAESAFGRAALSFDTYGRFNTALGYGSMRGNVSGSFNTMVGEFAEGSLTQIGGSLPGLFADLNTGLGAGTLLTLTSGTDNNALGEAAGAALTTGTNNTAIGSAALNQLTTGSFNTALGNTALFNLRPTSAAISAFSNPGGGFVQATSNNHGLSNGNSVLISGSTVQIPNPAVAPLLSQNASGGSIGAGTYFFKITLFSNNYCAGAPPCETLSSPEGSIVVAGGSSNQLIVTRPNLRPALADGFCIYASTTTGNETKQGCETGFSFPLNIPGTFTLNTCCSAGAAVPGSNGSAGNNYNGNYSITVVDANNFKFPATFVGTQTGSTCSALSPCVNAWWTLNNSALATNNVAVGSGAGNSITTGGSNIIIGANSFPGITTGGNNTVIGTGCTGLSATLQSSVVIGDGFNCQIRIFAGNVTAATSGWARLGNAEQLSWRNAGNTSNVSLGLSSPGGNVPNDTLNANAGAQSSGIEAAFFGSQGVTNNISLTGALRLGNTEKIGWRDSANGSDHVIGEIQTQSAAGCTTTGGATAFTGPCTTTITWPSAFADANYRVSCVGIGPFTAVPLLQGLTAAPIAASVTVQTQQATGVNAAFTTIQCMGIHQ